MMLRILTGDCRDILRTLDAGSVQTCVTSPPYYALRDYQVAGQIGLESTVDAYVAELVSVFRAVRRVLRDDGTLWLVLGDSYASNPASGGERIARPGDKNPGAHQRTPKAAWHRPDGLKPKDLIGIPWRVAFALQADGWYLRADVIWHKPNPMPESVRDRPTKSHEYLFLLSKAPRYFYDAAAIAEPSVRPGDVQTFGDTKGRSYHPEATDPNFRNGAEQWGRTVEAGAIRNKRSVWTVATQPFRESHFAVFPPKLIEPCILAGTSERGQCPACGAPWVRVVEREGYNGAGRAGASVYTGSAYGKTPQSAPRGPKRNFGEPSATTKGWAPSCPCDAGPPIPQTVLDPFGGAGTTGLVADRLGRDATLIELNPEYAEMAKARITGDAPLFAMVEAAP